MRAHCRYRAVNRGWLGVAVAGASLLSATPAQADTLFRGRDVLAGTQASLDVVEAHRGLLQVQDRLGHFLTYLNWTTRWAPGRMVLGDGQRVATNLSRNQFNLGVGFGAPEKFGVFVGANMDFVLLATLGGASERVRSSTGQSLLFAGVGLSDVQVSIASMQDFTSNGMSLDPWGNFTQNEKGQSASVPLRTGSPLALYGDSGAGFLYTLATVYDNHTGASLSVTWGEVAKANTKTDEVGNSYIDYGEREKRITEIRVNYQPLRGYVEQLRKSVGVPSLGARKLDQLRDPYGDLREHWLKAANAVQGASAPTASLPLGALHGDPYEVDLGGDDVLGIGLRWHVNVQVAPEAQVRRGEVAYIQEWGSGEQRVRVAARGLTYRRASTQRVSADLYAMFSPTRVRPVALLPQTPLFVGLSYSYNSPDSTTFLPIVDAHVFGVQLLLGEPEAARPLVPLVRTASSKQGAASGGAP